MPIDVPFVDLQSIAESQLDADRVVAVAAAVSGVVETRDGDTFAIDATKDNLSRSPYELRSSRSAGSDRENQGRHRQGDSGG